MTESDSSDISPAGNLPTELQLETMRNVLARATPAAVPSGILYRQPVPGSALLRLTGGVDSPAISQEDWEQALSELRYSALGDDASLSPSGVESLAAAHRERGHVPIFIAEREFHTIRTWVWVAVLQEQGPGADALKQLQDPGRLFEKRRAFFASAILPGESSAAFEPLRRIHRGRRVSFLIPSDGILGPGASDRIEADFGDGLGFRQVTADEPAVVTYAELGTKTVRLRCTGDSGPRAACFLLTLETDVSDEPAIASQGLPGLILELSPVPAKLVYPEGAPPALAQAKIYFSRGESVIRRPVLILEGFPFNYPWETCFKYANQRGFAQGLIDRGYDVILVRFPSGPVHIQANAYAFIELLKLIVGMRQGTEPVIVGGFSTGGLIGRYALAYMEDARRREPAYPHHETSTLFTVDTPHEGANVSIAVQALAQIEKPDGDQAKRMRTPAAQQMLLVWVPPFTQWNNSYQPRFGPSPERTKFVEDLKKLESKPRLVKIVAIADGAGDARFNQAAPGSLAVKYACFSWADLFFCPSQGDGPIIKTVTSKNFKYYELRPELPAIAYDSAPGGIWEDPIFDVVWKSAPGATKYVDNGCFIPTTSALGISGTNYFTSPDLSKSIFDKVTYHQPNAGEPRSLIHVQLTDQLIRFLREHVFGIV